MPDTSMEIETRLWVKRDGVRIAQLQVPTDEDMQLTCTADAEIKMKLTAGAVWDGEFDYNLDTVVPALVMNGKESQMGEYVITGSRKISDGVSTRYQITAFDLCYRAKKTKIERRMFFEKGTLYTAAITQLLVMSGIVQMLVVPSGLTFATDREDWDPGTSALEIINQLLEEMNYNSLFMGLDGVVCAMPYRQASPENVTIVYRNNEWDSLLLPGAETEIDAFDHPNVFYYTCENPELDTVFSAVAVNDSPTNPFSTARQGRVAVFTTVDNVPNQATLQAMADRAKLNSMVAADEIRFSTALNPAHGPFEIIELRKNEYAGVIAETEWRATLGAGGTMEHVGRKAVYE